MKILYIDLHEGRPNTWRIPQNNNIAYARSAYNVVLRYPSCKSMYSELPRTLLCVRSCTRESDRLLYTDSNVNDVAGIFEYERSLHLQHLQELLTKSWSLHEGQICVGVSWDRFTGIDQAKVNSDIGRYERLCRSPPPPPALRERVTSVWNSG